MRDIQTDTPLISVVVPIYNVETYLNKCVESIVNQTYTNLEVILVNDGSTDNCGSICDEYAVKDNRIIVIHKKNGGLSDARNVGLDICKGDYVIFIDSDDYFDYECIEYLYSILKNNNADIAICEYKYVTESGKIINSVWNDSRTIVLNKEESLGELCEDRLFPDSAWAKLYKTEAFRDIRYPIGHLFEDTATTYKLFMLANKIVFGRKALYNYLYRFNAISKQSFKLSRLDAVQYVEEMCAAIINEYPKFNTVCQKRMFIEYIYVFKALASSFDIDKNIAKLLYGKICSTGKIARKQKLSLKMRCYYIASLFGCSVLLQASRIETYISRKRI